MTREEAIMWIKTLQEDAIFEVNEALLLAIEALQDKEDEPQFYTEDDYWNGMFTESAEAYKAWTGEEMGRPHGRLIDADKLKKQLDTVYNEMANERERKGLRLARWFLISAPTVSADRPHGEWEHTEEVTTMDGLHWHIWRCTNCNRSGNPDMNFCPNCGADMRGGEDQ